MKSLVNYDEKILDDKEKNILKLSIIFGLIISIILLILIICKVINYQIIIGYDIGISVSILLFINIVKIVKRTNYLSYKSKIKKNYFINLIIYAVFMIILTILTKNIFCILSFVCGIITHKICIYIYFLKEK